MANFNNLKPAELLLKCFNQTRHLDSNSRLKEKSLKTRVVTIPRDKAQLAHLEALFSKVDSHLEDKQVVIPSLSLILDLD